MTNKEMKRAIKSFEHEECHKRWNNKNCRDIGKDSSGPKHWKKIKKALKGWCGL
jgi:hypothetical protein